MNEKTFKERDAERKRIKYWFQKCVNAGLIPHTLDGEEKLRSMFREWQESKAIQHGTKGESQPALGPRPEEEAPERITAVVPNIHDGESWGKSSDQKWNRELRKIREADEGGTYSERSERLRWGESSLIFGISSPKTRTFPMKSDSDKYIRSKKRKQKEKSNWNF